LPYALTTNNAMEGTEMTDTKDTIQDLMTAAYQRWRASEGMSQGVFWDGLSAAEAGA